MDGVLLHYTFYIFIMFELKKFQNEQFGLIRTMVDDQTQEVVFNGNDVAKALGYVDVKQALRDHTKGGVVLTTPSPGGPQKMKYLTELGYIFQRSTLPIQRFVNAGIFELHTSLITVRGRQKEVTTTKVTAKGQEYFLRKFCELA